MYLTIANRLRFALCAVAALAALAGGAGPGSVVRYATGNDIWALAGSGDTLWMITAGGVNFTIDTSSDTSTSLNWWGYTMKSGPLAVHFSAGRALVCLSTDNSATPNDLWWYDHNQSNDPAYKGSTYTIPFNRPVLQTKADSLNEVRPVSFYCYDLARDSSYYWLAFQDGGLLRWEHNTRTARVFPVDRRYSVLSDSFPMASDSAFPDTNRRVLSVDVADAGTDTELVYVATPHRIWRFSPSDSTWDTLAVRLAEAGVTATMFLDVTVNNRIRPAGIFAFIKTNKDSIMLYKYDDASPGQWVRAIAEIAAPHTPKSLTFGPAGRIYVGGDQKSVFRLTDQGGTALFPQTPADGRAGSGLDIRLDRATDVSLSDRTVQDVLCTVRDTVQRLWIASANGLYYSRNEIADETANRPLRFYRRTLSVPEGMRSAYAFPGLLTNQRRSGEYVPNPRVEFAYNLDADAKVTIRVYDSNMDLVKTVIENQPRIAGSKRQFGRSTEPSIDIWDGTNRNGRIVAPGVYYYRISTDAGDRATGRIVVALQRQ